MLMDRRIRGVTRWMVGASGRAGWVLLALAVPLGARAQQQDSLPSARSIMERAIKEVGGQSAFSAHRSVHTTGKIEISAQGITGTVETWKARPDRIATRAVIAGMGEIGRGYDGTTGWSTNPATGPQVLQGAELALTRYSALWPGDWDAFQTMETVAATDFEGKPCYQVHLVTRDSLEVTLYYDRETGLQRGTSFTQESAMGKVPVTAVLSDYQDFNGIKLPTRTVQRAMGIEQVLTLDSVDFDTVPDSAFALPPEIKALVGKG